MPINLSGVLLPITTPFTSAENVDTEGLVSNLAKWNETGINGYVVLGSTGERANLDEAEYLEVIETARRAVPQNLTFIAGAGQQSTRGTIKEIERAAVAGAEAVLVITPSFYKSAITQDALVRHYQAVADEFMEHANQEQEHADRIAERIRQLGGAPDFNPEGLLTRSHAQYAEGTSLIDMIKEDLIAERIAIESYMEMIRYFGDNDPTSRRLMEDVLEQEEEHADDMATLLETLDPREEMSRGGAGMKH